MPLTIATTGVLAVVLLDWPPAAALLVAAVLAPTDPVLAAEVRVGEPADSERDDDEVRFTLTAEAGLNDGLAFPFVLAAIALAAAGGGWSAGWIGPWVLGDLLAKTAIGIAAGLVTGRLLGWMFFRAKPSAVRLSEHLEGFVALGATFLSYGIAEIAHGYGFLAVFVTACTVRAVERNHGYHKVLHEFTEQIERMLTAFFLFLLGAYLAKTGFDTLTWPAALLGLLLVLAVRPVTAWVSQIGLSTGPREKIVTSAFGIRGIGSLFYLAYALGHNDFNGLAKQMWSLIAFTVLVSVILHGITATPVITRLDRLRRTSRKPP
ncbi:cation:proton antiporter, partial [Streptomyces sp. NPDC056437]|uniref:cation:proton antiporter domain-containing protein n=1 Tax=Streptomyces sp. NPDC056437 TaxID=3345816 RepID=UPI003698B057